MSNSAFSIGIAAGGGSPGFDDITNGTNTTATMTVGTGASIGVSGSGSITATTLSGLTATTTELNYTDGVTSSIQTQLDGKQPLDAQLTDISGLSTADGNFIVGDGANFIVESGDTARGSLSLGTGNSVQFANVTLGTNGAFRTNTGAANTVSISAYDVDGAAYTSFITLTANNTPTCTLSNVTSSTALNPTSSDGAALGTTALMWSDLFLATGAVINFNNGDVAVTHSSNTLAFTGASSDYTFDARNRIVAARSDVTVSGLLEVAGAEYASFDWQPAANTGTVRFSAIGYGQHSTNNDITGIGHLGGVLGYAQKTGTGTDALVIGVEGRVGAVAGSITIASPVVGTFDTDSENAGTITYGAAFYVPTQSDAAHITNKFAFWNNNSDWQVRTNGPIVCASTTTGDQQVIPRTRGAVATNVYYPIEGVTGLFAGTAHTRNIAWAAPWVCSEKVTWTRAGFTNGTGVASAVGRMGIYTDSSGRPGARIADFGTVTAGVADTGAREITISQTLEAGFYWLVLAIQGGASDNSITYASVNSWNTMGMTAATAQDGCCYVAAAGALPDPFGSPTVTGGGFAPFMWMRKV